jgi:hypothetical protein
LLSAQNHFSLIRLYTFLRDIVSFFAKLPSIKFVKNDFVILLLIIMSLTSVLIYCSITISPSVNVNVDLSSPITTSHFSSGITLVDDTLNFPGGNNDLNAANKVKSLMKKAIRYVDTPTMAWGLSDPWPDPSQTEPNDWSSLDGRLQLIEETGAIPVITLNEAPWWMKGQLQPDKTTRLIAQSEEWSDIAYSARILDNEMGAWLHLVQRIAERYMVAPYNVRYFQVWNELKGYYNPITNAYDYTTSPGDPSGPNATHGYTYMYNQVYNRLMHVATSLGIPTNSIKVGGPYPVIDTWSTANQSNPSNIIRNYGVYDQRPLDVVQYWLQHKAGAGFITLDGSNSNKDNVNITDPFTASEKFSDVTKWIRSLDNTIFPGATTLPIWWAEWYASPYIDTRDNNYNNAVKSFAMIEFIKAGGAVPFLWGSLGDGTSSTGLWTATVTGGGRQLPWYYSYKAFNDYFGSGTRIYKTTISMPNSIEALASSTRVMLVNKTANAFMVSVNGEIVLLNPFQVDVISL